MFACIFNKDIFFKVDNKLQTARFAFCRFDCNVLAINFPDCWSVDFSNFALNQ